MTDSTPSNALESADAPIRVKDRILEAACRLFYQDGIQATGIDKIIAEAGVAKMSFYRNFKSKADLVAAYMDARHEWWMAWFIDRVEHTPPSPNAPFTVITDVLSEWFAAPDFRGCAFINAVVENGKSDAQELRIAQRHKAALKDYLAKMARKAGHQYPDTIAEALLIIIEGTIVRAQMKGAGEAIPACYKLLSLL